MTRVRVEGFTLSLDGFGAGPDQDIDKIEFMFHQAISVARESIKIVTPYFLPEDRLLTALSLAAMRGIAVDVVIPAVPIPNLAASPMRVVLGL